MQAIVPVASCMSTWSTESRHSGESAPAAEEWAALSPGEKAGRIEEINASLPLSETMSEGTQHSRAKRRAADTLESYFARTKKGIFVAEELSVMFPGERLFVPDVLA